MASRPVGVGVVDVDGVVLEHDGSFASELGTAIGLDLVDVVSDRFGRHCVERMSGALDADAPTTVAVDDAVNIRIGPVRTGRREVRIEPSVTISSVAGTVDAEDEAVTDPLTGLGNRGRSAPGAAHDRPRPVQARERQPRPRRR